MLLSHLSLQFAIFTYGFLQYGFSKSVFCIEHMRSASEVTVVKPEWNSEIGERHVV
jgi:hypothetical protein